MVEATTSAELIRSLRNLKTCLVMKIVPEPGHNLAGNAKLHATCDLAMS